MSTNKKTLLIKTFTILSILSTLSSSNIQSNTFKCPSGYSQKKLNEFIGYGSANTTTNTIASSKNTEGIFSYLELLEVSKYSDFFYVIRTELSEVSSQDTNIPSSNIIDSINLRIHEKLIDFSNTSPNTDPSKKTYLPETLTFEYDTFKNEQLNDLSDYTLAVINCLGKTSCDTTNQVSQVPTKFQVNPNGDTDISLMVNINMEDQFLTFYISSSENKLVYKLSLDNIQSLSNHYLSINTFFKGTRKLTLTEGVACFNPKKYKEDVELNIKKSFCWPSSIKNIIGKTYKKLSSSMFDCVLLSSENNILGLKQIESLLIRKRISIKFVRNGKVVRQKYTLDYNFEEDNIRFYIKYDSSVDIVKEIVDYSFSKKRLTLIIHLS